MKIIWNVHLNDEQEWGIEIEMLYSRQQDQLIFQIDHFCKP